MRYWQRVMKNKIEKLLGEIFTTHFSLSDLDWSVISDKVKLTGYKKNAVIRPAGQQERDLYYIIEGATASILFRKDKLVCIDICLTGEFSGDYQALITRQKSALEIRAITRCTILSIPFDSLLKVYRQKPKTEVEKKWRIITESLYILKNKEIIDLKTLTAKERYLRMLEQEPECLRQISLKYLAAYLGISAESLSRIRKELATQAFLP